VTDPALVLADEPTGSLDTANGEEVLRIFRELNASGRTLIIVTHEPVVAAQANRQIRLRDGLIVEDSGPADGGRTGAGGEGPPEGRSEDALR
jgi:ABC-type lipoprotein export system ATPase subunit